MEGNLELNQTLNNLKGKISATPKIDSTLSKEGRAADAKATGDALREIRKILDTLVSKD